MKFIVYVIYNLFHPFTPFDQSKYDLCLFFTIILHYKHLFLFSMKYFWHISIYLQNNTRRNACHQIVIRVCLVAVKVDNPLVWSASVDSPKKEDKRDFVGDWQDYQNINELLVMYALD